MAVRRVVIVAFDGVQILDVTGPHEVFALATQLLAEQGREGYRIELCAVRSGPVRSDGGLSLYAGDLPDPALSIDTLIVPGGDGARAMTADDPLIDWLRSAVPTRLATVCTGAFVAASAGLLNGHRVTTHWARANALGRAFPDLTVDAEPVYIEDGNVWSSAGVTAGIDLALALVARDFGSELAQTAARWLVMFLHRPANQSQFAVPVWTTRAADDQVRQAQELIDLDPAADHRVGTLAHRVAMSERHFQRRFVEQTGVTPGQYVADIRLEAARRRLEQTDDTLAVIATHTGFGSVESLRRVFLQRLDTTPGGYRQRFTLRRPQP